MLTRIYGTAWRTSQELEEYLHKLEEAKKRDHASWVRTWRYSSSMMRSALACRSGSPTVGILIDELERSQRR